DPPACRRYDHARGLGRRVRRVARARAPDRGPRLGEGAAGREAPRRRDGNSGASAGAIASNPFPLWEKLPMDVSPWERLGQPAGAKGVPLPINTEICVIAPKIF